MACRFSRIARPRREALTSYERGSVGIRNITRGNHAMALLHTPRHFACVLKSIIQAEAEIERLPNVSLKMRQLANSKRISCQPFAATAHDKHAKQAAAKAVMA